MPAGGAPGAGEAIRHDHVRAGVKLLRVETFPPFALAIGPFQIEGVVANTGLRAFGIIPICRLEPMPGVGGVVADAEPQAVLAGHPGPGADDVALRPHVDRVPSVMLGVVIVEIVVVVGQRDEILRARPDVQVHERFRLPLFGLPQVVQFHEPEFRGMTVGAEVIIVLAMALDVHLARIPITLFRDALGRPMRPQAKLRVAEPGRTMIIGGQGLPVRLKAAGQRFARKGRARGGAADLGA